MKVNFALLVCSLLLAASPTLAKPQKTKGSDAVGTTFLVRVDWDARAVETRLTANPAELSGAALERSMQSAVYFGSAVGCKMRESGRKQVGSDTVLGALNCPWFE